MPIKHYIKKRGKFLNDWNAPDKFGASEPNPYRCVYYKSKVHAGEVAKGLRAKVVSIVDAKKPNYTKEYHNIPRRRSKKIITPEGVINEVEYGFIKEY